VGVCVGGGVVGGQVLGRGAGRCGRVRRLPQPLAPALAPDVRPMPCVIQTGPAPAGHPPPQGPGLRARGSPTRPDPTSPPPAPPPAPAPTPQCSMAAGHARRQAGRMRGRRRQLPRPHGAGRVHAELSHGPTLRHAPRPPSPPTRPDRAGRASPQQLAQHKPVFTRPKQRAARVESWGEGGEGGVDQGGWTDFTVHATGQGAWDYE
jgi:hypothetical protein